MSVTLLFWSRNKPSRDADSKAAAKTGSPVAADSPVLPTPPPVPPSAAVAAGPQINEWIARLNPQQPAASKQALAELLAALRKLPPEEAARRIIAFLDSGADAGTGSRLRVGPAGRLEWASSLRVALLDWLPAFDSVAAGAYAATIYAGSHSADEWALALRNHWRQAGSADPEWRARVRELFNRDTWYQQKSAGFIESVDFAVAMGGEEGWEILAGILARDRQMRRPVLSALDGWVLQDRAVAIALLVQSTEKASAIDGRTRAALMSRADVRDPSQAALVRAYLASRHPSLEEKAEFLRQFPNQNMMLGNRLATTARPTSWAGGVDLDAEALRFVDALIASGAVQDFRMSLQACRDRLVRYVESARRGG